MKKWKVISVFLIVLLGLEVYTIFKYYNNGKELLKEKAKTVFRDTVGKDLDCRRKAAPVPFSIGSGPKYIKNDSILSVSKEGVERILHTSTTKQESLQEKEFKFFQSIYYFENPIQVDVLNSTFRKELQKEGIKVPTITIYFDNLANKTFYSRQDTANFILIDTLALGVENEMTLQAYVKIIPASIFKNMPVWLWWLLAAWGVFAFTLAGVGYVLHRKVKSTSEVAQEQEQILREKDALLEKMDSDIEHLQMRELDLLELSETRKNTMEKLESDLMEKEDEMNTVQIQLYEAEFQAQRNKYDSNAQRRKKLEYEELLDTVKKEKKALEDELEAIRKQKVQMEGDLASARKQLEEKEKELKLATEKGIEIKDDTEQQISKNIIFYEESRRLFYRGNFIKMSSSSSKLLSLFFGAKDYYLPKKELLAKMWGYVPETEDCLRKAIYRLRRDLDKVPELKLEVEKARGYRLRLEPGEIDDYSDDPNVFSDVIE